MTATLPHVLMQQVLQNSFNAFVDITIKRNVSDALVQRFRDIESDIQELSDSGIQREEDISRLVNLLAALVYDFGNTIEPTGMYSEDEASFYQGLCTLVGTVRNYQLIFMDLHGLRQTFNRLIATQNVLNVNLTGVAEIIESTKKGKPGGKLAEKSKRQSNIVFSAIKGLDDIVARVDGFVQNYSFSDKATMLILTGAPGTGKTLLAHSIASQFSEGVYYNFGVGELSAGTVGDTENDLRTLFDMMVSTPNKKFTIVLDEFDNVVTTDQPHLQSVRITIQTELERLTRNVFVVAITNFYDNITDALKRRATSSFYVPIPDFDTLFAHLMSILKIDAKDTTIGFRNFIQQLFDGKKLTNSNVTTLVRNARNIALLRPNFRVIETNGYILTVNPEVFTKGLIQEKNMSIAELRAYASVSKGSGILITPSIEDFNEAFKTVNVMTDEEAQRFHDRNVIKN